MRVLIMGVATMRDTICAATSLVTLGGVTKSAQEWARERGVKWQTVKMRRYRGSSWGEALRAGRHRNPWNALGSYTGLARRAAQ